MGTFALALTILASPYAAAEHALDAHEVVIDLYNADVDIYLDPTASPVLLATTEGDEPKPAFLERSEGDGVLELRRPAGEDTRIKVDVVAGAEQKVSLSGVGLRAVARETEQPGVTAPLGLQIDVDRSEVDMEGGRDAVIEARESSLWLARTRGVLSLTLHSGSAEVRGHEGHIQLESTDAELTLIDPQGRLQPALTGGSLDVRGGSGNIAVTAEDATLLFDGWRGPLTLTGNNSSLDATGMDAASPWNLRGQDLRLALDRFAGPVTAELTGGDLRATTMARAMNVTATYGAVVELDDLSDVVILKLSDQASARLTEVAKKLTAQVDDARLVVDGSGRLLLTGSGAEVEASRVERLVKLQMSDSQLFLDLTEVTQLSAVSLQGTGRAEMTLPMPCRVRIEGSQGLVSERIDVTGCELRIPGQPDSSSHSRLIYGDQQPIVLTVSLSEDVELDIEGLPVR